MARPIGFEPIITAWQAVSLPLTYGSKIGGVGFLVLKRILTAHSVNGDHDGDQTRLS